jgi:uncharacterized protein YjiK
MTFVTMRVSALRAGERTRLDVGELSGLATRGSTAAGDGELLAISDERTDLFRIPLGPDGPTGRARAWDTGYAAPSGSGSNFEGVAADGRGAIVVVTESPPGLVLVDMDALAGERFMAHLRVLFDERSMRHLAGIDRDDPLQPEGLIVVRDGHVLVAHEKQPRGLFELGPPGRSALGLHPSSYLPDGDAFARPLRLEALAWWPVDDDRLDDISDVAAWDHRLFLLSDQSGCLARLGADDLPPGADAELDAVWTLPEELEKAEGLTFAGDGQVYVGLDVDLEEDPRAKNLVRFPALSRWTSVSSGLTCRGA